MTHDLSRQLPKGFQTRVTASFRRDPTVPICHDAASSNFRCRVQEARFLLRDDRRHAYRCNPSSRLDFVGHGRRRSILHMELPRLKKALIKEIPVDVFYRDAETDPFYPADFEIFKLRDRHSTPSEKPTSCARVVGLKRCHNCGAKNYRDIDIGAKWWKTLR